MFASMLGFFLTFIILLFIMIGVIAGMASRDPVRVADQSVLHLTLTTEIVDRGGGSLLSLSTS